jgi:hypothetical protein
MSHKKIALVAVCIAAFICVSGIGWAMVYSPAGNDDTPLDQVNDEVDGEVLVPEQVRDAVMEYIEANHPETAQFMGELVWTGGKVETGLLGAEIYNYESEGWNVTISYPVIVNPVYDVTVNYSVPDGVISIPYAVIWEGTWENGTVTEASFVFAQ